MKHAFARSLFALFLVFGPISTQVFSQEVGSTMVPYSIGLRLRGAPNTGGKVLASLALWERLEVLEVGGTQATFDGITGPWVKVRRSGGLEGWCFGGYLASIDPGDFVPFIALDRKTGEAFTCYNNGKCRERLAFSWNGKAIDRIHSLAISGNGDWIAFYWSDPERAEKTDREIDEYRCLFAYDVRTNKLTLVEAAETRYSDPDSAYWKERLERPPYMEPEDFMRPDCYDDLTFDYEGTRLAYRNGKESVTVYSLSSGKKTTLSVGPLSNPVFMGKYLYGYTGGDEINSDYALYDISSGKGTGEAFRSGECGGHTLVGFAFGRYFLVNDSRDDALTIRDSVSGTASTYAGSWPWIIATSYIVDESSETLYDANGISRGQRRRVRKFDRRFRACFDATYDVIDEGYIRQGMADGMATLVGDAIVEVDHCTLHIDQRTHPYNDADYEWRLDVYKAWALRPDGSVREYEMLREADRKDMLFLAMNP